jgi:hypothetical protein
MLMYLQKLQERQFLLFPQGRRRPRVKYSGHRRVSVCRIDVLAPLDMDTALPQRRARTGLGVAVRS